MEEYRKLAAAERARLRSALDGLDAEYSHEEFQRYIFKCTGMCVEGDPVAGKLNVYRVVGMRESERHFFRGNWWGLKGVFLRPAKITIRSALHYNWALVRRVLKEINTWRNTHEQERQAGIRADTRPGREADNGREGQVRRPGAQEVLHRETEGGGRPVKNS